MHSRPDITTQWRQAPVTHLDSRHFYRGIRADELLG